MNKLILFILVTFSLTHAIELPKVKIKDVDTHLIYSWVEVSGVVTKIHSNNNFDIYDESGSITVNTKNNWKSKREGLIHQIAIGDTLTIEGELKQSTNKSDKITAYRIKKDSSTIFRKVRKQYPLPLTVESSELNNIIYSQKIHLTKRLKGLRIVGGVTTSIGAAALISGSIIMASAEGWDFLYGFALMAQSTSFIIPGCILLGNTKRFNRKLKALPEVNKKVSGISFNFQLKPVAKGGGLFLTGNF